MQDACRKLQGISVSVTLLKGLLQIKSENTGAKFHFVIESIIFIFLMK